MAATRAIRPPLLVAFHVWRAIFLREAVSRIARGNTAWIWMLVEPVGHMAIIMYMYSVVRQRIVIGADTAVFVMLGVLAFILQRNMMNRCRNAIVQNRPLFTYRQILPVDVVLVRAAIEGFLQVLVMLLVLIGAGFAGREVVPVHPLSAIMAVSAMLFIGLGLGLIISVLAELAPDIARIMRFVMTPLYFLSAVLYPSMLPPPALRDILLYNPIVHAIESLRVAFMPRYQVPDGISLTYAFACAVPLVFLGLLLHVRYQKALLAE